jgi:PhzF family phenazine biosynthesis protein
MANDIEIYQIDAFTSEMFRGNPAAVVFNNSLSNIEKQLISKEMNLSETAFISSSQTANYKLQWFTPAKEVNLCGHATIASLHFLFEKGLIADNQNIAFETLSGIIKCSISKGKYLMQIPIFQLTNFDGCKEEIINALGVDRTDVSDLPFILVSNGYLFIYINSLTALWNLKPDFRELLRLSKIKREFTDVTVFTTETVENSSSAHLRFFAPFDGIDEDPVTGSACGPLLIVMLKLGLLQDYLEDKIIYFEQGDVLNRKGRVGVKYNSMRNELFISGNAITVLKGKLLI